MEDNYHVMMAFCHISTWTGQRHTCVPSILNPSHSPPHPSPQVVTEHQLWVPSIIHQTLAFVLRWDSRNLIYEATCRCWGWCQEEHCFLSSALLAGVQGAHCAIQGEGSWGCPPAQLSFLNTAEWQVLKAESQETWDPVPTVPLNSLHDACWDFACPYHLRNAEPGPAISHISSHLEFWDV